MLQWGENIVESEDMRQFIYLIERQYPENKDNETFSWEVQCEQRLDPRGKHCVFYRRYAMRQTPFESKFNIPDKQ
jgi:hypothetical protein